MNGETETCHCGHDKSSHYFDLEAKPAARAACLVVGCEDCKRYAHTSEPRPAPKALTRPQHILSCRCYRCKQFLDREDGRGSD